MNQCQLRFLTDPLMAKELEITSIICFLSALIAACSRRLFIKTKRDSKRRDSSEGVKKTREVWVESHNVLHPSRLNPTFLTFSLLRCFLTVYNFVPFYELNACNRLPSLVFFFFFDGRLFSYRILCSNS